MKERAQIESNLRLARTATQSLLDSYYRVWEGEEVIIEHINWIISKLRSVWVNPYLRPARYTTALLKEARKVLTEMPVIYLEKGKKTKEKERLILNLVPLARADLEAALVVLQE